MNISKPLAVPQGFVYFKPKSLPSPAFVAIGDSYFTQEISVGDTC